MMPSSDPITFYDIASNDPLRTFAPNPWKTRFALNFKGVSYKTQWTQMPDITSVREKLGVPANRTLPDGSAYHTLPVIQDESTGALIGDTFEIALYLDQQYQNGPKLFRPNTTGLTAAFNAQVDGIFTKFAGLCELPFDPDVKDQCYTMFAKRFGMKSADDMKLSDEARQGLLTTFEHSLGELAKAYKHTGGTTDYFWRGEGSAEAQRQRGPEDRRQAVFLDGDGPAYADFVVGAWLKMMEACLKDEEWERVRSWQSGHWGKVVDALEPWSEIK